MGTLHTQVEHFDSVDADVRAAHREPLFTRLQLRPHVLLCTRPHVQLARSLRRTSSGLYLPKITDAITNEFAIIATVLRAGAAVPAELREPGTLVLAAQFSGRPVYDLGDGVCSICGSRFHGSDQFAHETVLWLLGDSEIIATVTREAVPVDDTPRVDDDDPVDRRRVLRLLAEEDADATT